MVSTPDPITDEDVQPAVSVVIPTYLRGPMALDTVRDLLACHVSSAELIVVDQSPAPPSESANGLEELVRGGAITYIHALPPSLPYARNIGLRHAHADVIVFCDDDIRVGPDFLERHLACYEDPVVGAVAGGVRLLGADDDGCGSDPGQPVGRLYTDGSFTANFHHDVPQDVDHGMGCNMSFRRQALIRAGGFDERYQGNFFREDSDAFARVKRLGYRARFEPRAACVHLRTAHGGSRAADIEERLLVTVRNETLFFLNACKRRHLWRFLNRMARWAYSVWRLQLPERGPAWLVRAAGEMVAGAWSWLRDDPLELSRSASGTRRTLRADDAEQPLSEGRHHGEVVDSRDEVVRQPAAEPPPRFT